MKRARFKRWIAPNPDCRSSPVVAAPSPTTANATAPPPYLPRSKWSKADAQQWIASHHFNPIELDETRGEYRYRIREPEHFNHYAVLKTSKGINLVIGFHEPRRVGAGLVFPGEW